MKVYIVAVGDEILSGRILDYNTHWVTKRLSGIGFTIVGASVVPDDKGEIVDAVKRALSKADLVVTTGGLGPTPGDITLEAIAEALNSNLVLNEEALRMVERRYRDLYELGHVKEPGARGERAKMALLPEGGRPVFNEVGVAPGVVIEKEGKLIVSLPGVPSEMMYLLEKVIPLLEKPKALYSSIEDFIDEGDESLIASALREVMGELPDVSIKTYPSGFCGKVRMKVIASTKAESREKAEEKLRRAINLLKEKVAKRRVEGSHT
ncbi:MAG: competence damage-inducible protein A [Candidatus Freyarchaeota archaeon]|nr:competence damage-inducible protein A [Candidatus Jordarchaeia archaeon]